MSRGDAVVARVAATAALAQQLCAGTPLEFEAAGVAARLMGPLRVALVGRVKAGKSTLLNALVGERLAPTDAGECTRVVSWYHEAMGYEVRARLRDGSMRELPFRRDDGVLTVDLRSVDLANLDRLDVGWPSSALRRMTLIDTPGLASINEEISQRTIDFMGIEDRSPAEADAVVYLMRHLHSRDADFLEAFTDRSLAYGSPVNAVAVLARADEVGAGRLDAMDSAQRIAERYRNDEHVRSLCYTVLPVAGLVAETALTLQEHEAAALRAIAGLDTAELDLMLLSADRFCAPGVSPLAPEIRRNLLARFGLFGLRYSLTAVRRGEVATAADLSRGLVATSGLPSLQHLLAQHFDRRAQLLKARSALGGLRALAHSLTQFSETRAARLMTGVEELEATTHEFAELRLVHLMATGIVTFDDDRSVEVARVTGPGPGWERAGLGPDATPEHVRQVALQAVERWRSAAGSPLADPATREACEIVARSYEGLYADPS